MSVGYVPEATAEQILALYKISNPEENSPEDFSKIAIFFEVHHKLKMSALASFDTLNKMHVTYDEILHKINAILEEAKSQPTTALIEKIFLVTTRKLDDTSSCGLCDHKENRVVYRITNTDLKKWFEFESINLHSLDKHHNFSYLGNDSHWQIFPTNTCQILQLYFNNIQDNIPKDPLIDLK